MSFETPPLHVTPCVSLYMLIPLSFCPPSEKFLDEWLSRTALNEAGIFICHSSVVPDPQN